MFRKATVSEREQDVVLNWVEFKVGERGATHRFSDLDNCRHREPKQVLSFQVNREEFQSARLGSLLSNRAQNLVPHS